MLSYLRYMTLKLWVGHLNFVVGDLAGNSQKNIEAARSAYADSVRLFLTLDWVSEERLS